MGNPPRIALNGRATRPEPKPRKVPPRLTPQEMTLAFDFLSNLPEQASLALTAEQAGPLLAEVLHLLARHKEMLLA
jgi:hypothetical protein